MSVRPPEIARRSLCRLVFSVALLATVSGSASAKVPAMWTPGGPSLFGGHVAREALHFQVAFGWGVGPDSSGLFHAMELGHTLENGWTLAYLHTLIQTKGFGDVEGAPDLFAGHLFEVKVPMFYPEIVLKVGAGPGAVHVQGDELEIRLGMSWAYGIDLHYPIDEASGFTLCLTSLHTTVKSAHHWGVGLGGGYTFF